MYVILKLEINGPFCTEYCNDLLHTTLLSWIFKHKFVLFLKIRTEVVCIVMRDKDARAGIALKLIYKAGNAKYYHPTHNFYNLLLSILSKICFKEIFVYPPFEYIDRGIWAIASPKTQRSRQQKAPMLQSAVGIKFKLSIRLVKML